MILAQRYPGLRICGRSNGYVPAELQADLVADINRSGAAILFTALGSPRQEMWIRDNAPLLTHVRICQGVGGTLDTITGKVPRAPVFFQRIGLEWFYRLMREPSRIFRAKAYPLFVFRVILSRLRGR